MPTRSEVSPDTVVSPADAKLPSEGDPCLFVGRATEVLDDSSASGDKPARDHPGNLAHTQPTGTFRRIELNRASNAPAVEILLAFFSKQH